MQLFLISWPTRSHRAPVCRADAVTAIALNHFARLLRIPMVLCQSVPRGSEHGTRGTSAKKAPSPHPSSKQKSSRHRLASRLPHYESGRSPPPPSSTALPCFQLPHGGIARLLSLISGADGQRPAALPLCSRPRRMLHRAAHSIAYQQQLKPDAPRRRFPAHWAENSAAVACAGGGGCLSPLRRRLRPKQVDAAAVCVYCDIRGVGEVAQNIAVDACGRKCDCEVVATTTQKMEEAGTPAE